MKGFLGVLTFALAVIMVPLIINGLDSETQIRTTETFTAEEGNNTAETFELSNPIAEFATIEVTVDGEEIDGSQFSISSDNEITLDDDVSQTGDMVTISYSYMSSQDLPLDVPFAFIILITVAAGAVMVIKQNS